jgi:hypothetical protein
MPSKYLRIEPNETVRVSLKYQKGLAVSNNQTLFTLSDGRKLYASEALAKEINSLNQPVGEEFRIQHTISKTGQEWLVEREVQPEVAKKPAQSVTRLEYALRTAVAAAASAERHGAEIGYQIRFTPADIRAMGISVLIGMQQEGRR